jgi:small-conductance mechanosensitive channel
MFGTIDLNEPGVIWRIVGSAVIAVLALGVIFWIGRLRGRAHAQMKDGASRQGQTVKTKKPLGMAHLLLSLAIIAGAGWVVLQIWGIDTRTLFATDAEGGFALRGVVRVIVIVAIAAAALEITNLAARTLLDRVAKKTADHRRRAAKLRTVAPLISGLINAVILFVAVAMVLSEAGIEVAPLLAGAGVAGIAIGFGAQSLVKDLFTGAFLVIEDIVSHGDVVEISGVTGKVEAMTLRTIRLRSFDGTLHIFPYGEAQVIHNKTASFSSFAFELQISYLSSIDDAIRTIEQVGEEVAADPDLKQCLLGRLELAGVDRLSDNGVVIKGRIRTLTGENARVGSVFLKRVKERLDEAGVLISHRHLPVPPFEEIRDQVVSAGYASADGESGKPN